MQAFGGSRGENKTESYFRQEEINYSENCYLSQAETAQTQACEKFDSMSACGKEELVGFRARRVAAFKKS